MIYFPQLLLHRSPTDEPGNGGQTGGGPSVVDDKPTGAGGPAIPQADQDLYAVARAVSTKWTATPGLTLVWTNSAAYAALVSQYDAALRARNTAGAQRPGQTFSLAQMDDQIDKAAEQVKNYLKAKYGNEQAPTKYPLFGIVKEGKNWRLPRDRDDRLAALNTMITAIGAEGFGTNQYGTDWWGAMLDAYDPALKAAQATDSSVSTSAATKEGYKEGILKTIRSLRYLLRANYPDSYEAEYRAWGMQKEDY